MSKKKIPILLFGVLLFFLTSPPAFTGYSTSDSVMVEKTSECLACHEEMATSLKGSAHQITSGAALQAGCIGCHDGWDKHLMEPSSDNILQLSELSASQQADICRRCHAGPHQTRMASSDPHMMAGMSCLSCHAVHDNGRRGLLKDDSPVFCAGCHQAVAAEFRRRSAHPIQTGNIVCADCHNAAEMKKSPLEQGLNWTCQGCHAEKAGPFLHEHPVAYNHLVDGGGCVECHEPHGSSNDRLLRQPESGLCLQCHALPAGHRVQHSGLGAKMACAYCHSEIHGSNDNRLFLDPDLGIKLFPDCYQSGCHSSHN